MNITDIREKYPAPKKAVHTKTPESYCVGGALCLFNGLNIPYPGILQLADLLYGLNKNLGASYAWSFAKLITSLNDAEDFEASWKALDKALNYGREL